MQQYYGRALIFLGGLALVLISGVWKPDMPQAGTVMTVGVAMITLAAGIHTGEKMALRRKK